MWDAVTYVETQHNPIISEGRQETKLLATNAGPGVVELLGWHTPAPGEGKEADIKVQLRPGNTTSIAACLIRARLVKDPSVYSLFAALGWRILP